MSALDEDSPFDLHRTLGAAGGESRRSRRLKSHARKGTCTFVRAKTRCWNISGAALGGAIRGLLGRANGRAEGERGVRIDFGAIVA
jgi:hypothetical protein